MKKLKVIPFCLALLLLTTSCTICSTCRCEKDGETFTEEECAKGINQREGLERWQRIMAEEKEYEACACVIR